MKGKLNIESGEGSEKESEFSPKDPLPIFSDWAYVQEQAYEEKGDVLEGDDSPITAFIEWLQGKFPNGIKIENSTNKQAQGGLGSQDDPGFAMYIEYEGWEWDAVDECYYFNEFNGRWWDTITRKREDLYAEYLIWKEARKRG